MLLKIAGGSILFTGAFIMSSNIIGKIKVDRELSRMDHEFVKIDKMPLSIVDARKRKLDISDLNEDIRDVIDEFISVMNDIPHVDLSNFYANFKTYKIVYTTDEEFDDKCFNNQNGDITISPSDLREHLIRGLICMASWNHFNDVVSLGFRRTIGDNNIGDGLSFSYINLLLYRYFDINEMDLNLEHDVRFALALFVENIVGKEKMESAFFRGALDEVINELARYSSAQEATIIVREIDHVVYANSTSAILSVFSRRIYRDVVRRLSKVMIKKLLTDSTDYLEDYMDLLDMLSYLSAGPVCFFRYPKKEQEKALNMLAREKVKRHL